MRKRRTNGSLSPWLSWPGWWCQPLQPPEKKKQGCDSCYILLLIIPGRIQIFIFFAHELDILKWFHHDHLVTMWTTNRFWSRLVICVGDTYKLQSRDTASAVNYEVTQRLSKKNQPELVVTAKITMKINAKSNRIFFWIMGWGMRKKKHSILKEPYVEECKTMCTGREHNTLYISVWISTMGSRTHFVPKHQNS